MKVHRKCCKTAMQAVPQCSDTAGITGTKFFRDYPNEPISTTISVSASKIPSSCSELVLSYYFQ